MILNNKEKRIKRVRAKISGTTERPRLAVFRSNKYITAQLIDDVKGLTLGFASSETIKDGKPLEKAKLVGVEIAKIAKEAKIAAVVFDRRDKQYHGQVKALAEGARENGLNI